MMNTEPSHKPNAKLRWYQPKKMRRSKWDPRESNPGSLYWGHATGALSIEIIPLFSRPKFPGFDSYTGPIGGELFGSTTYITDVPEGKDICCTKHGNKTKMPCAGCEVLAEQQTASYAGNVPWRDTALVERIRAESVQKIRDARDLGRQHGAAELKADGEAGLDSVSLSAVVPFYSNWPFVDGTVHVTNSTLAFSKSILK
jgi:hypothetical protein